LINGAVGNLKVVFALLASMIASAIPLFPLVAQEVRQVNPYEQLGRLVSDHCPAGFHDARLEGELDTDWAQLKLICVNQSGEPREQLPPAPIIAEMHDALDAIREEMARQSGSRWMTFAFSLTPQGRFNFDVQY
jgi:hypothetical protein